MTWDGLLFSSMSTGLSVGTGRNSGRYNSRDSSQEVCHEIFHVSHESCHVVCLRVVRRIRENCSSKDVKRQNPCPWHSALTVYLALRDSTLKLSRPESRLFQRFLITNHSIMLQYVCDSFSWSMVITDH